ncbi:MAG: hypothetical protein ABSA79_11470 [Candidatus Bathyarchaeia archaeon]|jgi:hypothetical protein
MPKLTVFEKNEAASQTESDYSNQKTNENSSETTSITVNKPGLIDIGSFDSEKTKKADNKGSKIDVLSNISAQRKFDDYLIESIDEALTSLGAPVKNTVYFQLENNFNIPKNEIPQQIDEFTDIMHKIFGLGASRLEIKFMKNLYSKIQVNIKRPEYEWPLSKWIVDDISFTAYVHDMRENYCNPR